MHHLYIYAGTFSKDLDKMIYLQNRRYLLSDDVLRSDSVNFPDKVVESCQLPLIQDYSEMRSLHDAYECVSSK